MLTAERHSAVEINLHHVKQANRIRNSLIQAVTVPFHLRHRLESSIRQTLEQRKATMQVAKKHFKNIHKFEIVVDKRTKNEDVTTALQNYTADSVRSLKTGENNPCIKDYLNVKADSFEPGDLITGHVLLMLTKPAPIEKITLNLRGLYIVAYETRIEGESTTSTEQITFLDASLTVYKCDNPDVDMDTGLYRYDFRFKLPLNIPGTMFFEVFKTVYEGASVVYSLEAQIHAKEDYMTAHTPVARELITVIRLVPERLDTEYHKPYTIPKRVPVAICCFGLGYISLSVTLSKLIYMEGDAIRARIFVSNDSKLLIQQVDIALVQYSSFRSRDLEKYCLRSKTTLLAYTIPMNFLGLGDAENDIALTLPDEMQPSTIINIKPPSHHNLKADHVSKTRKAVSPRLIELSDKSESRAKLLNKDQMSLQVKFKIQVSPPKPIRIGSKHDIDDITAQDENNNNDEQSSPDVNGFKDAEGTRSEASDTDENTKSPNSQTGRLSGGAMEVQNDKNGVEMRLHKTSRKSSGESTFLLLEHNYHILFDISYYLMIKVRTNRELLNMKGPEIHFPITVEGVDFKTRQKQEEERRRLSAHLNIEETQGLEADVDSAEP